MNMTLEKLRKDFPILSQPKPVTYFDNACMTLKPVQVIEALNRYYREFPACGGRSMHKMGKKVTDEVAAARRTLQKFINARKPEEIVFTKNTTEAINLVAHSLRLGPGDRVLTSDREHNSNLLPWQRHRHETVKSKPDMTFDLDAFEKQAKGARLVAMVHTSNLDGYTLPAREIVKIAHDNGALVLLDAAQSAPHKHMDVRSLDADFLAFSGHKMLGPTGTGVLYGKYGLLEKLSPFMVGGETVTDSTYEKASYEKPPEKFEAGLQHYAGIIGLGEAASYLMDIRKEIEKHETALNERLTEGMLELPKIELIGPPKPELRSGIFSFNVKGMGPHDVALILDQSNIAVRSGAHCVHSWFNAHGLQGSVRASLYLYNTKEEVERFLEAMKKITRLVK